MNRKFISFIFISLLSFSLFSAGFKGPNRDYFNMKLSGEFGLINGTINEYVFADYCKNTDNMMSRLDWDILTIPYIEGDLTFNIIKYIYINANGRYGIPTYSGLMQDYDWMNSLPNAPASWQNDSPTQLTNYSKHANQVDHYYNWSVKAGGNIPIGEKVSLTPYIGYKYDYIEMSAYNGYRRYKVENFEKTPMPKGKGITYAQEINSMILGLNLALDLIPSVPIQTYLQFVPGVGKLAALDLHHLRKDSSYPYGLAFLDQYKNIFELEWKISAFYELNRFNRLGLSSFIQYMPLQKGVTGTAPINKNGRIPKSFTGDAHAKGGAGRFLYSFSVIYQFNL